MNQLLKTKNNKQQNANAKKINSYKSLIENCRKGGCKLSQFASMLEVFAVKEEKVSNFSPASHTQ